MEHSSSSLDLPVSDIQMKMVGHASNNLGPNHFFVSNEQLDLAVPMANNSGFKMSVMENNLVGNNETSGYSTESSQVWMSKTPGQAAGEKAFLPVKRKADVGSPVNTSNLQRQLQHSKRPSLTGASVGSTGLVRPSAPQRRTSTMLSKAGAPDLRAQPLLDRKLMGNNSNGKNGSDAVRSKMKESLTAALSLADMSQQKVSNIQENQITPSVTHQLPVDSKIPESNVVTKGLDPGCSSEEVLSSKEVSLGGDTSDSRVLSDGLPSNENRGNGDRAFQDFQYGSILPDEDIVFSDSFFAKDDLLQGNGLSWAFDFDVQMRERLEAQNSEKLRLVEEETQGHRGRSAIETSAPENVASEIEAELFILFGGVNKKYKEKGRSLLFNLKDRNNPELRERVMSGEISPEKLCSMSAEELASKELSEWRTAKAEEFAQMVVLPDTEVDIRRLVKKSHKGEYQLEIERDDGLSAEVSGGTTMLTQPHSIMKTETGSPSVASPKDKDTVSGQKSSENQDFSGSLIIPADGTDLMQGMMVDELKDAEFLPPIVSLDEFMESLSSEPPFENLSSDAAQKTVMRDKEGPKVADNSRTPDQASVSPKDASQKNSDVEKLEVVNKKLRGSPAIHPSDSLSVNYIWEGILQLNMSTSINVGGVFQSGEKTSTKEWPSSLEIKGRVRLDSFEKFLKELHRSQSRAVMVMQFVLRDKSTETQHSSISKAIDSFAADERLGYAESSGFELYLCPPTSRMTDVISEHVPRKQSENDDTIENGLLIGVVVWRRPHKSNMISPNNSSYNKHGVKKQSLEPPKGMQVSSNAKINVNARAVPMSVTNNVARPSLTPQTDEDDDVPPGFGLMASARTAKDDDDLPEFHFSGHLNQSMPQMPPQNLDNRGVKPAQRSVDQVRELIQKYGQSGGSVPSRSLVDNRSLGIEPWIDDDDDIPEWQPQMPNQLRHQPYQVAHSRMQPLQAPLANQRLPNVMSPLPPRGREVAPSSGGWVTHPLPPGPQGDGRWRQY